MTTTIVNDGTVNIGREASAHRPVGNTSSSHNATSAYLLRASCSNGETKPTWRDRRTSIQQRGNREAATGGLSLARKGRGLSHPRKGVGRWKMDDMSYRAYLARKHRSFLTQKRIARSHTADHGTDGQTQGTHGQDAVPGSSAASMTPRNPCLHTSLYITLGGGKHVRSIVTTSQHRWTEAGVGFLVSCFIVCTYSSARSSVISKPVDIADAVYDIESEEETRIRETALPPESTQ